MAGTAGRREPVVTLLGEPESGRPEGVPSGSPTQVCQGNGGWAHLLKSFDRKTGKENRG